MPAIRWDAERGFAPAQQGIDDALALGVGGFIIFGGERAAVRQLTADLRAASPHPLLIASDLERGAGQQVAGLTPLPPLGALRGLGEDAVRRAAAITAREARDVGINWIFAPDCDLDIEPANPIVQTRSFGADPLEVARLAVAWGATCQAGGVLACAKHFPGHGRTTVDSHATLPVVDAAADLEHDLVPFRRMVEAGVASVMTAHISYPAWDHSGAPATYSGRLITELLRGRLGFDGLVVTDALIMEGARGEGGEAAGAARVIAAGGDLLLYPHDPHAAVRGLTGVDIARALGRLDNAIRLAAPPAPLEGGDLTRNLAEGRGLAQRAVSLLRGGVERARGGGVRIELLDDDAGGPYPLPPRTAFAAELARAGVEVRPDGARVVAVFVDVKSWKGRAGLSGENRQRLAALLAEPAVVVLFGHPRRLAEIPGPGAVVCAWSGDVVMQEAAARWVAERLA